MRKPWQFEEPLCRDIPGAPEIFIDETSENKPLAKAICARCAHQVECAEYGIKVEVMGVWGGLTTRERSDIAKRHKVQREPLLIMPAVYKRPQRKQVDDE